MTARAASGVRVRKKTRQHDFKWQPSRYLCRNDPRKTVFELKPASASLRIRDIQQKNSIPLNAAILVDLEARGLDPIHNYPLIVEAKGISMDFYALSRYCDVIGAVRATGKGIILPSYISGLRTFLLPLPSSHNKVFIFACRKSAPFITTAYRVTLSSANQRGMQADAHRLQICLTCIGFFFFLD